MCVCVFHNGCISDTKIEFHVLVADDKGSIANVAICKTYVIYALKITNSLKIFGEYGSVTSFS